jgi:xylan 1,4-beta-xylosidase
MVRVRKLADRLNEEADKSLDMICQQCGFSSIQYATKVFRMFYLMPPGEYRRNYQKAYYLKKISDDMKLHQEYLPVYQETDYAQLELYSKYQNDKNKKHILPENFYIQGIDVDISSDGHKAMHDYLLKMISIGRASEGLRAEVKQQLSNLQKELRFSYIRFYGVFNDEMKVLNIDVNGNLIYSWTKVDYLLDFFMNIGLRPFIDLASMPTYIADGNNMGYSWIGNTSQPKDVALWCDLVQRFLIHCIERFGRAEVEKWYIEVWKQPDLAFYWKGSREEYFSFYEITARIIREILPKIKIGGPSISSMSVLQGEWIPDFIRYCRSNKAPLDYISFSIYPEIVTNLKNQLSPEDFKILPHNYVDYVYNMAKEQGEGLPLIVDEWNISFMNGNPVNDSPYAATSLLSNTFCQVQTPKMMAHSMVVDNYDERVHKDEEYHGGHGLMTCHGTKKMSYWAFWCLRKMGNRVLYYSDQVYITKSREGIQLLLINHPILKSAYDVNRIQKSNLAMFKKMILRVSLNHCKGLFVKRTYTFSEECDPVEISKRSGITRLLNEDEAGYIISKSIPVFEKETIESLNSVYVTVELKPCEFKLILLESK